MFFCSEATSPASIKGNCKIKNCYTNKPIRLYNWNQPIRHLKNYTLTVIQQKKRIRSEDNLENSVLPIFINPSTEPRGQVQFCRNLIANLFEKGESPCTRKFPDVKIKRHYLKGICSPTSQYGIYTVKIKSSNPFHDKYLIQTDDADIEFSKAFTQYIKRIQHQNSQRVNSMFTNDVFSLI